MLNVFAKNRLYYFWGTTIKCYGFYMYLSVLTLGQLFFSSNYQFVQVLRSLAPFAVFYFDH